MKHKDLMKAWGKLENLVYRTGLPMKDVDAALVLPADSFDELIMDPMWGREKFLYNIDSIQLTMAGTGFITIKPEASITQPYWNFTVHIKDDAP